MLFYLFSSWGFSIEEICCLDFCQRIMHQIQVKPEITRKWKVYGSLTDSVNPWKRDEIVGVILISFQLQWKWFIITVLITFKNVRREWGKEAHGVWALMVWWKVGKDRKPYQINRREKKYKNEV